LDVSSALELVRILADRDYKHVDLLKKIKYLLLRFRPDRISRSNLKYLGLINSTKEKMTSVEITSAFVNEFQSLFRKLKFYEIELLDFMIDKQLEQIKTALIEKQNVNNVVEMMLDNLIFFQHNRSDVAAFILGAKFETDKECLVYSEDFPADLFLIYAGFIKFVK
jgi:hypothetical protein